MTDGSGNQLPKDVIAAAQAVVDATVWATLTTVGADLHPRSRLVHPVWIWDRHSAPGLVTSRPTPLKRRHLAENRYVSCFYWAEHHSTVAFDCTARWVADADLATAWDEIRSVAGPSGFDPGTIWPDGPGSDDFAVIELAPHRIVVRPVGAPMLTWRAGD